MTRAMKEMKRALSTDLWSKDPKDYHGITPVECKRCGFWWPCDVDPAAADFGAVQHSDGTWWQEDCPACTGPVTNPETGEYVLDPKDGTYLSQRMPVDETCLLRALLSRQAFASDLAAEAQ